MYIGGTIFTASLTILNVVVRGVGGSSQKKKQRKKRRRRRNEEKRMKKRRRRSRIRKAAAHENYRAFTLYSTPSGVKCVLFESFYFAFTNISMYI